MPRVLLMALSLTVLLAPFARAEEKKEKPKGDAGELLFDGKSLDGWKQSNFGGDGEIRVEDGVLWFDMGSPFTGLNLVKKTPTVNYEVSLEARRVEGNDFFCGLTFPVDKSHCSLIVGGWGGGIVGLSSIDGRDASENETTKIIGFERNRWYKIRLRVEKERISAWIDDAKVIDVETKGRKISIRPDIDPAKPFGLTTWQTSASFRNIRLRSLDR